MLKLTLNKNIWHEFYTIKKVIKNIINQKNKHYGN
ncbi:hypothetical protein SAMN05421847_2241 [Halpernia humi]|uniref:Uncharacterized protein n=1 Tax=Halpernia humi TaxID=493375 RepID=A0A1H5ZYE9_9FLAO|nr:hypothetical protein SAMN05421847_2241 [Halpernia humi]